MPRFANYSEGLTLNPTVLSTIEIAEIGDVIRQSTLKLTETPLALAAVSTAAGFGGVKLATFPAGRILVHGVTVNGVTWTPGTGLDAADGGDFALGTTSTEDAGALDRATDINLCPSTSLDPLSTAVNAALASAAQIDGTSTAAPIYFNGLIDAGDVTDDTTPSVGVNGTIVITWTNLGDY